MSQDAAPLSEQERAELEALRAEKAEREAREQAARERAELEALRSERARAQQTQRAATRPAPTDEDRRIAEARERGAKLMEPDDDLRMPMGQKIVLAVIGLLVALIAIMHFLVG